jgi:4-amino-4-deoxy-L-arabinose transferase-like glycosyltransferase
LAVLALTLLAGAVRLPGLAGQDGRMNEDEARLALAAEGVLRSGLPELPSGRIYTRGLLNTYLIAGAFGLLGRHDFAARLPSALAGALLVPVVFLLGEALSRTRARVSPAVGSGAALTPALSQGERGLGAPRASGVVALAAASFVALAEPLVDSSRSAWLPSVFLLLFTLSVYCCYRGFVERRAGWQVAAAGSFWLALLSYEFAVLLPAGVLVYLAVRIARGDRSWYRGQRSLLALAVFGGGLVLFGVLAMTLRAGSTAGPLAEVRTYAAPGLDPNGIEFYLRLLSDYHVLFAVALLGLPLLARARPRGALLIGGLLALAFLLPSLVIQVKNSARYALPLLPLLAVLAAAGTARLVRLAGGVRGNLRLELLALLAVFGLALHEDVLAAVRRFQQAPVAPTWLQALRQQGFQETDLVVTDSKETVQFYLGRDEFYIRPSDNERYVYQASDRLRSIYTDATLISQQGDFERLVEAPHPERTLWWLGRRHRLDLVHRIDPDLWPSLLRSSEQVLETRDGWVLLKVRLPRR